MPCAERPYFFAGFVRGNKQVVAISFLDLLKFIANVKFVTEALSVTEIMLRLYIYIYICVCVNVAFF